MDDPPWRAFLLVAAHVARVEGWSAREAVAWVDRRGSEGEPLLPGGLANHTPAAWIAALEALAASTIIGRLFCADCFEDWRFGPVDDVASSRVAAAVRRLRARDPSLEVLDLRDEGPLDDQHAGVLGAAAGHAPNLTYLDLAAWRSYPFEF